MSQPPPENLPSHVLRAFDFENTRNPLPKEDWDFECGIRDWEWETTQRLEEETDCPFIGDFLRSVFDDYTVFKSALASIGKKPFFASLPEEYRKFTELGFPESRKFLEPPPMDETNPFYIDSDGDPKSGMTPFSPAFPELVIDFHALTKTATELRPHSTSADAATVEAMRILVNCGMLRQVIAFKEEEKKRLSIFWKEMCNRGRTFVEGAQRITGYKNTSEAQKNLRRTLEVLWGVFTGNLRRFFDQPEECIRPHKKWPDCSAWVEAKYEYHKKMGFSEREVQKLGELHREFLDSNFFEKTSLRPSAPQKAEN